MKTLNLSGKSGCFGLKTVLLPLCMLAVMMLATQVMAATITVDSYDTVPGTCTLRDAITAANTDTATGGCAAGSGDDTITFAAGLAGKTITLASRLYLTSNITIDGSGLSLNVKISGNNYCQVFQINSGKTVVLKNLDIINGRNDIVGGNGGGIYNQGTLTVSNSTFSGNWADASGGGIYNGSYSTLTVSNSTFSGNTANSGGGIANSGTLTVSNSTFSGNSASNGGGIINGGTLTVRNTILANSTSGGDCRNWGTVSAVNNLIKDSANACGLTGVNSGNIIIGVDPLLSALADNGGSTQTMALQTGSPAVNAGNPATCEATDQRGYARVGTCDIGAYEYGSVGPPPAAPSGMTATTASQTQINLAWTDNSSNETGFKIFRNGSLITTTAADATSYNDTGLTCNTAYTYTVKAGNANGDSAAAATTPATATIPCIPSAPSGLTATAVSQTQIDLRWADNSSDETDFKIFRNGTQIGTAGAANKTTYTDTAGLGCGTYSYEVKATNAGGDSSGTTASATTWICPGVNIVSVSNVTASTAFATGTASGGNIGERGFYWWIPPTTATHFGGSESGLLPSGSYGAGDFSLNITGLRPGNTYHIKAYVKVGGQIISSDEQLFTTATTGATGKAAPTVLTDTANYTVSGNSITVSGEITDIGSTPVNVYGFVYAPHSAPFTGDDMLKTGDRAYAMWDRTPLYQGMKFTGTIKNIPPGKWYLRAYAHNTNPDSSASQPESLSYGEEISFTIACTPETCIPGDVNGDGSVDLADAMLVLRILSGIPVANINLNADVNGDGKIGLEELGYILQKVSGLR